MVFIVVQAVEKEIVVPAMFTDVYSRIQVSHYIIVTRNRQKPIQSQKNDNNFHIDTAKETGLLSFHTPEVCERK